MGIKRILHVEDDADIREITRLALVDLGGFDLLQCANGVEALEKAAAFGPDLMLLDVMMPGMSGPETLSGLRAHATLARIPAIFMTSKDMSSAHASDIEALAIGVIPKPFDPVALPDQLRSMVAAAA